MYSKLASQIITDLKNRRAFNFEELGTEYKDCTIFKNETALPFFDMPSFASYLGISTVELSAFDRLAGKSLYKTFYIDKKTHKVVPKNYPGNLREICAPIKELKEIQKKLIMFFEKFPIHSANAGFVHGKSLKDAVEAVKTGETLIHVDLEKFFDNHSSIYVKEKLREKIKNTFGSDISEQLLNAMVSLVCKGNRLPQGSPASPCLVVTLNYDMDEAVDTVAKKYNLVYTRYADDLAFAGTIDNKTAFRFINDLVPVINPFRINFKKLGIMRNSSKPIFKNIKVTFTEKLLARAAEKLAKAVEKTFPDTNIKIFKKTDYSAVISSTFFENMSKEEVITKMELLKDNLKEKFGDQQIFIKPKFFYVQHTKRLLGLNIQNGTFNFPRRDYENLRLISMLVGRQQVFRALMDIFEQVSNGNQADCPIWERTPLRNASCMEMSKIVSCISMFAKHGPIGKKYRNLISNPIDIESYCGLLSHIKNVDPAKYQKLHDIRVKSFKSCRDQLTENLVNIFHDNNRMLEILNATLSVLYGNKKVEE